MNEIAIKLMEVFEEKNKGKTKFLEEKRDILEKLDCKMKVIKFLNTLDDEYLMLFAQKYNLELSDIKTFLKVIKTLIG